MFCKAKAYQRHIRGFGWELSQWGRRCFLKGLGGRVLWFLGTGFIVVCGFGGLTSQLQEEGF